jgi:hypothetical protein
MYEVTPEFVAEVVKAIPKKEFWEYILLTISALTPICVLIFSYLVFKTQHIQSKNIKLIEKDIERLYNSADLFFDYADSVGLFYSMTRIKSKYLLDGIEVPSTVEEKTKKAGDDVYNNFGSIHKSIFLLRSIGENDVATLVENYRKETIEFRKEIIVLAKWDPKNEQLPELLSLEMINKINDKKEHYGKQQEHCLKEIAQCKKRLTIDKVAK